MLDKEKTVEKSHKLAVRLYDKWVRQRQGRPMITKAEDRKELNVAAKENFQNQLLEPRRKHLQDISELSSSITFADKAALLVMMELPTLETSTLLHRLGRQIAEDPNAAYFSKVNLADNCGCGCGCGCGQMMDLDYRERFLLHHQTKPYSIDPFNELKTAESERDSLLVKDFLESFEKLSSSISTRVNSRYYEMGVNFATTE